MLDPVVKLLGCSAPPYRLVVLVSGWLLSALLLYTGFGNSLSIGLNGRRLQQHARYPSCDIHTSSSSRTNAIERRTIAITCPCLATRTYCTILVLFVLLLEVDVIEVRIVVGERVLAAYDVVEVLRVCVVVEDDVKVLVVIEVG
jgi:hypothetical protein